MSFEMKRKKKEEEEWKELEDLEEESPMFPMFVASRGHNTCNTNQAVATSFACTTLVLNSVSLLYQCNILQQKKQGQTCKE